VKRSDGAGLVSDLILVDREGALGDPDAAARGKALDNHERWLEAARALGCRGIRINAESRGTPDEQRALVIDGGYRGRFLEIEYEGEQLGEVEGTRATKRLLERTLAAL